MDMSYCRLCAEMKHNIELVNVFDNNTSSSHINFDYKIYQCFRIAITVHDSLPKVVCSNCFYQAVSSFIFYEKIVHAQDVLRNIFGGDTNNGGEETKITLLNSDKLCKVEIDENVPPNKSTVDINDPDDDDFSNINVKDELFNNDNHHDHSDNDSDYLPLYKHAKEQKHLASDSGSSNNNLSFINEKDSKKKRKKLKLSKKRLMSKSKQKREKSLKRNKKNEKVRKIPPEVKTEMQIKMAEYRQKVAEEFKDYIWRCHICSVEMKTKEDLIKHFKNAHDKAAEFSCLDCSQIFTNGIKFKWHVRKHRRNIDYRCTICDKWFYMRCSFRRHMDTVHNYNTRVTCPKCGKTYKSLDFLKIHDRYMHAPQIRNEFICDICHKTFKRASSLSVHKGVHKGEKKFVCDTCGHPFRTKGNLKNHIICKHSKQENAPPLEVCNICSKAFKTTYHLKKHITRNHIGNTKIHTCETCGKKYNEKSKLNLHQTLHTGELPHKCQFCEKRFRLKSNLKVHIRQHTGEKPYSCLECKRDFTDFSNYHKHNQRKHNMNLKEPKTEMPTINL